MHEASLMHDVLGLAAEHARQAGSNRIRRIRLRVGTMAGAVPDALRFAFEALAPGTPAAGATLEIDLVPVSCHCPACGEHFAPDDFPYQCPQCGSSDVELRAGRELELNQIEVFQHV
jgi:hydrogenase nickel incorporation protein HypA/HybF